MTHPIWTPCIKVCFVDPAQNICVGCFRTMEELGRWTRMSDIEREAVKAELSNRKSQFLEMTDDKITR